MSLIRTLWVPIAFLLLVAMCYNIADDEFNQMEQRDVSRGQP
jgi:sensor domain CHASE-containing protein